MFKFFIFIFFPGFVRDYSAKTFSLLMRKLKLKIFKSQSKLLLKAVATNCKSSCVEIGNNITSLHIFEFEDIKDDENNKKNGYMVPNKRIQDLLDGLALLFFNISKGVKGCLHSKGGDRLSVIFDLLLSLPLTVIQNILSNNPNQSSKNVEKQNKREKNNNVSIYINKKNRTTTINGNMMANSKKIQDLCENDRNIFLSMTEDDVWMTYALTQVLSACLIKLFRHLHPSNLAELWLRLLSSSELIMKAGKALDVLEECSSGLAASVECSTMFIVEALLFGLCHTKGRGISDSDVKKSVENQLINVCLDLCETGLSGSMENFLPGAKISWRSARLVERQRLLLCRLWLAFPCNLTLLGRIDRVLTTVIPCVWPCPAAPLLASELFPALPVDISRRYARVCVSVTMCLRLVFWSNHFILHLSIFFLFPVRELVFPYNF